MPCLSEEAINDVSYMYEILAKLKDTTLGNERVVLLLRCISNQVQDLVNEDFTKVIFWLGDGTFFKNPFPKNVEEYLLWIEKQLDFVDKRNLRIEKYAKIKS